METNKIKVILAAINAGSLSKAAEELLYTPSALSHMADSLEQELKVNIISRTNTGVSLTDDGKLLFDKLCAVVKAEEDLLDSARMLLRKNENTLRIGTYSSISAKLLPDLLTGFKKEYPDIRILITVDGDLQNWLEEGLADVIFADEIQMLGKNYTLFMEEPYMVVVPVKSFPKRRSVSIDELYGFRYICTNEELLKKHIDESHFNDVIHIESRDSNAILSMVSEGIGFAVLPALATDKNAHGYKALKLVPSVTRKLGFAYKKGSYATDAFADHLKRKLQISLPI